MPSDGKKKVKVKVSGINLFSALTDFDCEKIITKFVDEYKFTDLEK